MTSQDNYITMLWNLNKVSNIDWNKTTSVFLNNGSILELYLINDCTLCSHCGYPKMKIKGSRTQNIKTILRDGSYGKIHFHRREYICPVCNKTTLEKLDTLKIEKGISLALKMELLEELRDPNNTYQSVASKLHVSKTFVLDTFDKYVSIDRHKIPEVLCIDEIYSKKLTKTKYCCVLYNPFNDEIIDLLNSRRIEYLKEYFYHIDIKERNTAKYFISDLNETYRTIKNTFFKSSIHAVDSFHVIKNLNEAINTIRKRIMKEYENEKRVMNSSYWLFKKFYKLLLIDFDNIENKEYDFRKYNMILDKYSLINEILKVDESLKEAYYLGQEYRNFNKYYNFSEAPDKIDDLIKDFINSKSNEMKKFGYLLINWRQEIINSFIRVNGWRLSNGKMENVNRRIKLMFENAYGYSNFPRTRNRVLFTRNLSEPLNNKKKTYTNKRIMPPRFKHKHH